MSMTCTVCRHPRRRSVDSATIQREPARSIARRLGISKDAVQRHQKHSAAKLSKAIDVREILSAAALVKGLEALETRVMRLAKKAESEGDWRAAVAAASELRRQLELRGKLGGELRDAPGAGSTTTNYTIVFEGGIPKSMPLIEASTVPEGESEP